MDLLITNGMVAKRVFYEASANVPMILLGSRGNPPLQEGTVDNRLIGLQDVMPTLLELCNIPVPDSVDGLPMVGSERREYVDGECGEDDHSSRMIGNECYKLI